MSWKGDLQISGLETSFVEFHPTALPDYAAASHESSTGASSTFAPVSP